MKVTLIDSTNNPVEKLIFTKNTRLNMDSARLDNIFSMTTEEKMRELDYMADTIKSSWEFVTFTFSIEGVSRAFTHQFVRNRQGSYAQQTMRILDVNGFDYVTGPSISNNEERNKVYSDMMEKIDECYNKLIKMGASIEDARGILPTNICTNIVAQYNLRTLSDLVASRSSPRTQGEFRAVLNAMVDAVIMKHPWAEIFLSDRKVKAAAQLDSFIQSTCEGAELYVKYIKLIDVLRRG